MFLHIGGDVSVPAEDIILILDLKSAGTGVATKEFLEISHDEGLVAEVGGANLNPNPHCETSLLVANFFSHPNGPIKETCSESKLHFFSGQTVKPGRFYCSLSFLMI